MEEFYKSLVDYPSSLEFALDFMNREIVNNEALDIEDRTFFTCSECYQKTIIDLKYCYVRVCNSFSNYCLEVYQRCLFCGCYNRVAQTKFLDKESMNALLSVVIKDFISLDEHDRDYFFNGTRLYFKHDIMSVLSSLLSEERYESIKLDDFLEKHLNGKMIALLALVKSRTNLEVFMSKPINGK